MFLWTLITDMLQSLVSSGVKVDYLRAPRRYGAWYDDLLAEPEHSTAGASLIAGEATGVCGLGKVTIVSVRLPLPPCQTCPVAPFNL
jgi:hypothetical protein